MRTIAWIGVTALAVIALMAALNLIGMPSAPVAQVSDEKPPSNEPQEGGGGRKGPKCSGRVADDGSKTIQLPAAIPGSVKDVVVSNPGAFLAVSRFYRLLQAKELQASSVIAVPFSMDGRKILPDDKAVQDFFDKAREASLKDGRTNTLLQITLLPPGNTWDEAQRWLTPATKGERAKALFEHATKSNAWLALVLIARTKGETHVYEHTLIAITNADSEDKARVIGFMD